LNCPQHGQVHVHFSLQNLLSDLDLISLFAQFHCLISWLEPYLIVRYTCTH